MNIKINKGGNGKINSTKGSSGQLNEKKYIDLIPSPNNLRLYFDPIFYKNLGSKYEYPGGQPVSQSDPWYLKEFRDYNISNVVPSRPLSQQWIQGGPLGTTKAQIINNTLSYIKDPNNNDLEQIRFSGRNYLSISNSQTIYGVTPPVENKKPLLILSRDDNTGVYTYGSVTPSTLNIFVRLQRPLAHKTAYTSGIIREKKGIFCTYGIGPNSGFLIGYRSPHHYINGDRTYKFKFEPFSFVFGIGNGFSPIYSRPCYQTLMTDFKFKFGEMYMLTVVTNTTGSGNVLIYVNGELQSVANVPFNPLRKPSGGSVKQNNARKQESPIGPNFVMFDGSTFPYVSSTTTIQASLFQGNAFIFGKSNLNGYPASKGNTFPPMRTTKRRKRFFNNIDLGVINTYNIALSQAQISQFYENFRYRYE